MNLMRVHVIQNFPNDNSTTETVSLINTDHILSIDPVTTKGPAKCRIKLLNGYEIAVKEDVESFLDEVSARTVGDVFTFTKSRTDNLSQSA